MCVVAVSSALAAEGEITDVTPPRRAIVISPVTKVMQGDEATASLNSGQLLTFTKANGDWRFTPEFRGWVSVRDVVHLDEALGYFTKIINEKPSSAAFHHRGIAHIALGEMPEAILDLNQAILQGDKSTFVYVNRGMAHRETGEPDKAIQDFTQAIAAEPKNVQAYLLRGMLLLEQGHSEASLKDFDQAIANAPQSAEAYNQRGVALRLLNQQQDARAAFEKAVELAPEFADAYANRAFSACHAGEFALAIKDYEQALKLIPNQPEFLNDYAWLLATCRDEAVANGKQAVELSQQACSLLPAPDPAFLDTLAAAQARSGDFDAAFKTATQALELMGKDAAVGDVDARRQLYAKQQPYIEAKAE